MQGYERAHSRSTAFKPTSNREFEFETETLILFKVCLEAYDRLKEAKELLDKEGLTAPAATGGIRAHPGIQAEKMARSGFLQSWRMLNLADHTRKGLPFIPWESRN